MKRPLFYAAGLLALAGLLLTSASEAWGWPGLLLRLYSQAFALYLTIRLAIWGLRRFLWRVSRRLAFSYFLFGIVPIVLVTLFVVVMAYMLSGFFLGHVYRDYMYVLKWELEAMAEDQLHVLKRGASLQQEDDSPVRLAGYRNGRRVSGDPDLPARWPEWWSEVGDVPPIVADEEGRLSLLATREEGPYKVVVLWSDELGRTVAEKSGIWVEYMRPEDRSVRTIEVDIFRSRYSFKFGREAAPAEIEQFLASGDEPPDLFDKPWLVWVEMWRPFVDSTLVDREGPDPEAFIYANLTTSPRVLARHLVSRSVEVDALALAVLAVTAFLFFDLYVVAALLALVMISGLSRAVNRLTDATLRVQEGDFSARIEVQRRDQIGALQDSFNTMASNLQTLVSEAAQKEILEKDLHIAQELQHSLLPNTLEAPANLRFATHFAPSSAIGGDYYDLLSIPDGRLAVVIADVAGHGISAGLRMAMVKSALQVLSEREERPEEILREVHRFLTRLRQSQRTFVTLSLAMIDPVTGQVSLVNAGHLPTYLLRDGEVQEILLPSPPLGTLTPTCPKARLELEPGDALVWLSDGLVEAVNVRGEVFGFDGVEAALAGPVERNPAKVRDRLLSAVRKHTGEFPLEDDRTVVAMVYLGAPEGS